MTDEGKACFPNTDEDRGSVKAATHCGTASGGPVPALATGMTARDASGRTGRVMDMWGGLVFMRPLEGGTEWQVSEALVEQVFPSDLLSDRLAALNARSRGEAL
jgi:hypothetical protein